MTRESLERYQVVIYFVAVLVGGTAGLFLSMVSQQIDILVWTVLGLLLYSTFCQVSLTEARQAFRNMRFFSASLLANFVLVPVVVWILSRILPPDRAIRLGVFMVLLVPCTDWFVTFTHLGKGATRLAVTLVPIQLFVQFALLPLYLWVFMGPDFIKTVTVGPFVQVFILIILVPFALATLTRFLGTRRPIGARWLGVTAWLPVPLLALALFLVTASQAHAVGDTVASLGRAALVFTLYLVIAPLLARLMALVFRIQPDAGLTLAFNLSTRNSFVVLPLALALPAGWEATSAVIVLQTLIELSGMIVYLWLISARIFPTRK